MKIQIELNLPGDGRRFLNFWNHEGSDVVAEIRDGRLFLSDFDEDGNELPEIEITFLEFLERVQIAASAKLYD